MPLEFDARGAICGDLGSWATHPPRPVPRGIVEAARIHNSERGWRLNRHEILPRNPRRGKAGTPRGCRPSASHRRPERPILRRFDLLRVGQNPNLVPTSGLSATVVNSAPRVGGSVVSDAVPPRKTLPTAEINDPVSVRRSFTSRRVFIFGCPCPRSINVDSRALPLPLPRNRLRPPQRRKPLISNQLQIANLHPARSLVSIKHRESRWQFERRRIWQRRPNVAVVLSEQKSVG